MNKYWKKCDTDLLKDKKLFWSFYHKIKNFLDLLRKRKEWIITVKATSFMNLPGTMQAPGFTNLKQVQIFKD